MFITSIPPFYCCLILLRSRRALQRDQGDVPELEQATGGRQGTEDGGTPSLSGSARPSKRREGEISYFEVFFSSDVGAKVVNKK